MDYKRLRKISKKELLELLLEQAKRIEELEQELSKTKEELNSKKIVISESGSLAEASLKLSGIFELAQKVANEYIYNIQENCKKNEKDNHKEKQENDEYYTEIKLKAKKLTINNEINNSNKMRNITKSKKESIQKSNKNNKKTIENKIIIEKSKRVIKGRPVRIIKKEC